MAKATSLVNTPPFSNSPAPPDTRLAEPFWHQRQLLRLSEAPSDSEDVSSGTGEVHILPPLLSPKSRSLSDAGRPGPSTQASALCDSPTTKDDIGLTNSPLTPQRRQPTNPSLQGLSLHLPPRHLPSTTTPGASPGINRAPLSPKLDASQIYGSPASVLPRRSRGLDFSRACTNLHHSTLAESSPDSSPTIGGRGVNIPQRRGTTSSGLGSPGMNFGQHFPANALADRTTISSSVSSVNMMESDTTSSDDDEDDPMNGDRDDMMITATPQASKMGGGLANPFGAPLTQSPGNDWMGGYSPAAASLLSFQRARFRNNRKSRHSSSSASGNSSKPSPGPLSPPVLKSIEASSGGYFTREMSKTAVQSRRESLSLGTKDLHLSDLSDDGDSRAIRGDSPAGTSNNDSGPRGVIRRAVTRRGNLLPKTKTFSRIRAALVEEGAPLDSEAKREAEVIRQVRESEPTIQSKSPTFPLDKLDGLVPTAQEEFAANISATSLQPESSFSNQASRNSAGLKFWETFDGRYRTPPPLGRLSTQPSGLTEDTAMDTPQSTTATGFSRQSPPPQVGNPPMATGLRRKRRRDDDLDPDSFKRRAVSPGMSVQSSPVLAHSPIVKDGNAWVIPPKATAALVTGDQNGGPNNGHASGVKRVGLQGMTETSDGLMNMSIE